MRTIILYHPNSEQAGQAQDFKRDYENRHAQQKVELVSLETAAGAEMARVYDIVRYPAILVTDNSGGLLQMWQDQPWPLIDEVYAYAQN